MIKIGFLNFRKSVGVNLLFMLLFLALLTACQTGDKSVELNLEYALENAVHRREGIDKPDYNLFRPIFDEH
jgi:hypothetical protein